MTALRRTVEGNPCSFLDYYKTRLDIDDRLILPQDYLLKSRAAIAPRPLTGGRHGAQHQDLLRDVRNLQLRA